MKGEIYLALRQMISAFIDFAQKGPVARKVRSALVSPDGAGSPSPRRASQRARRGRLLWSHQRGDITIEMATKNRRGEKGRSPAFRQRREPRPSPGLARIRR